MGPHMEFQTGRTLHRPGRHSYENKPADTRVWLHPFRSDDRPRRARRPSKRPKTMDESLRVLQRANRFMGIQSFELNGKVLRIPSIVYALCLACGYYVMVYHGFEWYLQTRILKFEKVTAVFIMYNNIIVVSVLHLWGCLHTQVYKRIMTRIDEVDRTLEQLFSPTNNHRTSVVSLIAILCWITYQLVTNYTNNTFPSLMSGINPLAYVALIHFHCQNVAYLTRVTFIILVACLKSRFARINDLLREVLAVQQVSAKQKRLRACVTRLISVPPKVKENLEPGNSSRILRKSNHVVRTTKQLHLELCKISRTLCDYYSLKLLLILALDVIQVTNLLFTLYNRLVSPRISSDAKMRRIVLTVPLCFFYSTQLLALNSVCEFATREAASTVEIIHELNGLIDHPGLKEEINQFSLQTMQRPLVFSPLGFFTLNNNLMKALVGSVTTYAVILIQVGDEWQEQVMKNTTSLPQNASLLEICRNLTQDEFTTFSEFYTT